EEEHLTPAEHWRRYMDLKKSKLLNQINAFDMKKHISAIFEGISIYVNGYTDSSLIPKGVYAVIQKSSK
uniref:DNA repair protein REV1 n=1 Tax=Parascaris univalens TaxID=6257 RepID=A0A914ZTQ6_PARUN